MEVVMMMGRILTDGRMSARVKYDVNDRFSIKANAQVCFPLLINIKQYMSPFPHLLTQTHQIKGHDPQCRQN